MNADIGTESKSSPEEMVAAAILDLQNRIKNGGLRDQGSGEHYKQGENPETQNILVQINNDAPWFREDFCKVTEEHRRRIDLKAKARIWIIPEKTNKPFIFFKTRSSEDKEKSYRSFRCLVLEENGEWYLQTNGDFNPAVVIKRNQINSFHIPNAFYQTIDKASQETINAFLDNVGPSTKDIAQKPS